MLGSLELAPKPNLLDHVFAAGVPMGGLTAWQVLYDHAHLSAQDTTLIHGAARGVGVFAVQFAISTHAYVIATASSGKVEFLTDLADKIINYRKLNFEDLVHDVDVLFDTVGGTLERSWKVLRKRGRLVSVMQGQPGSHRRSQVVFRVV